MFFKRNFRSCVPLFASLIFLAGGGCTELPSDVGVHPHRVAEKRARRAAHHPIIAQWKEDETAKGKPRILINLTTQQASFWRGNTLIGLSTISSGRAEFETPPGKYRVIQKDANHVSSQFGECLSRSGRVVRRDVDASRGSCPPGSHFVGAPMPFFIRFTGGYGMHAGMVPRYRASHGCVRLPSEMAKHFFEAAEVGTPVEVVEPKPTVPGQ
jgi:hypothetical protein